MPDLARYDATLGERVDDVASMCPDILPGRARSGTEWLHQVRTDLGRLAPWAEIVQIGSALADCSGARRREEGHRPDPARLSMIKE